VKRFWERSHKLTGRVNVIIPVEVFDEWKRESELSNFFLVKKCEVFSRADKPAIRLLLEYYRIEEPLQEGMVLPPASQPSDINTYANKALEWVGKNKALTAAGLGAAYLATNKDAFKPSYLKPYTPPTAQSYGLNATLSPNYRPTFAAAEGGIARLADGGAAQAPLVPPTAGGLTAAGVTGLAPKAATQSQPLTMDYIQSLAGQYGYTIPEGTLPSTATPKYAGGGNIQSNLGGYSDGGRLLKGPGDGMSDNIPASIANKQPARLADGEFVVPADVVSHLGNGSTDAGAKHLYKMMDNVRKARTGRKAQGKQIKAGKYLPA
jgi:hypothetical protein